MRPNLKTMKANRSVFSKRSSICHPVTRWLLGHLESERMASDGIFDPRANQREWAPFSQKETETLHQTAGFGGFPLLLYFDKFL